jgi:hypothetical protein
LALLVYYAVFRLPFWFPRRQRLTSASYAFGFNNGVAILAVAVLLGTVTLLCLARPGGVSEPRIGASIFIEHFMGNENVLLLRSSFNRREFGKRLCPSRALLSSSKPVLNA